MCKHCDNPCRNSPMISMINNSDHLVYISYLKKILKKGLYAKTILSLLSFFLFFTTNSMANNFEKYFYYAENYYRLTVDENIGGRMYLKTLKYIKLANRENIKIKLKNPKKYRINSKKIATLKKEVKAFYSLHKYTMNGFFPLLKFISTSFYFLPKKSRKYTLQKNSDETAVEMAVKSLAARIPKTNQYHVFFNSKKLIWNEIAFEEFNSNNSFYAHLIHEVNEALYFDKNLIKKFYRNKIDKQIIVNILNYINKNKFIIVRLKKIPLEKGDSYIKACGNIYNKKGLIKDKSPITFAYSIDVRWAFPWIIGLHLILLVFVIAGAYYYTKIYGTKKRDTHAIAIISFLTGRILPWIIVPTLKTFMPNGRFYILNTFWWVALLGFAIMIFPIYGIDLLYSKLCQFVNLPNRAGKGGVMGFSTGAGIVGYLFIGYIFNFGRIIPFTSLTLTFSIFSLAILTSSYAMGLILDPFYKINEFNLIYFIALNVLLFTAFLHADFTLINLYSLIVIMVSFVIMLINKKKLKNIPEEKPLETLTKESVDLRKAIEKTPFYKFNFYKNRK